MRSALAYKPEHDEVSVSSTEGLEANVIAIRDELKQHEADFRELRTDFKELRKEFHAAIARLDHDIRTSVARLDHDIKAAVAELRAEIRAMAAKAESDLKEYAVRVDNQFREMRAEHLALRDKVDKNHEQLLVTDKKVTEIGTKLNALLWMVGGLAAVVTFFVTVGKAVGWF